MPTVEAPPEIYRTSSILAGIESVPRASVFLRDKLFSKKVTVPSDQVDISFYKGRARLAPYCSRFAVGTAVPRERQQLRLFSPPFMKPVRTLTADDVFYRSMGGPGANNENRDAELLVLDLLELDNDISRREEWMTSQRFFHRAYHLSGRRHERGHRGNRLPAHQLERRQPALEFGEHVRPVEGLEDGDALSVRRLRILC